MTGSKSFAVKVVAVMFSVSSFFSDLHSIIVPGEHVTGNLFRADQFESESVFNGDSITLIQMAYRRNLDHSSSVVGVVRNDTPLSMYDPLPDPCSANHFLLPSSGLS